MAREVIVDVLLGLAVAVAIASSLGVLVMGGPFRKLHYLTPLSIVAPVLVGLAVLVQAGYSIRAAQTWLAVLFMVVASPLLSHATIRAARIRRDGDWRGATPRAGTHQGGDRR
ncbi:MAG: monovalent cation/H(+) antiporter subunit G [Streptosporangiaceae bacterium]